MKSSRTLAVLGVAASLAVLAAMLSPVATNAATPESRTPAAVTQLVTSVDTPSAHISAKKARAIVAHAVPKARFVSVKSTEHAVGVKAVLKTKEGTVVKTVRWAATPAKGSVGPRSSNDSKPSFKVIGAPKGPQTASLTFKAVSPAGISSAPWTAGGKDDFPRTYAGKVTYTKTWDMGGGASDTTSWAVDVTYTLADQQANPDGTAQALYDLTSATISDFTYVMDSPAAGCALDAPASGAARIVAGDLEIRVSKGGAWTSGILVDATIGKKPNTCITKTQPSVTVKGSQEVKTFINTRLATGDLRPMKASGPVAASGVTDVMELGSQLGVRGSASWDLEPGR
jgi:hypothetical protein